MSSSGRPITLRESGELDEAAYRAGLRARGLDHWLEHYEADTPPADEVDARMRRVETLLEEVTDPGLSPSARRERLEEASDTLAALSEDFPDHPGRPRWQLEHARFLIEQRDPGAFEAALLFELPGRDHERMAALSAEAVAILERLGRDIQATWEAIGEMEEAEVRRMQESGRLRPLEAIEAECEDLLARARVYRAITVTIGDEERQRMLSVFLDETLGVRGDAAGHAGAGLLAVVAARHAGRFADAERYAGRFMEAVSAMPSDERERWHGAVLTVIVEQIRIQRDAGQHDRARRALERAREWAATHHPDDMRVAVALALAERGLIANTSGIPEGEGTDSVARGHATGARGFLAPSDVQRPLRDLAARSPLHRDALYQIIAGTVANEPLTTERSARELQLLAGAAVLDAIEGAETGDEAVRRRLAEAVETLEAVLDPSGHDRDADATRPSVIPARDAGELAFLLARARYVAGHSREAIEALIRVAEEHPEHDRAPMATEQAAILAQQRLREAAPGEIAGARDMFVRAGTLCIRRSAGADALSGYVRDLPFFLGLAIEETGEWERAAAMYAETPDGARYALEASLGRLRCLYALLLRAAETGEAGDPYVQRAARTATEATDALMAETTGIIETTASGDARCTAGQIACIAARIYNHAAVGRPDDALIALRLIGADRDPCDAARHCATGIRIDALRATRQWVAAHELAGDLLAEEPEAGRQALTALLMAMHDEMAAVFDKGDDEALRTTADLMATVAGDLIDAVAGRPADLTARERLLIRTWKGEALLLADRPGEALVVFEDCASRADETLSGHETLRIDIDLGRAECLLAVDRAEEALPVFTRLWQQMPEHTAPWWRAFAGSLACHQRLGADPEQLLRAIRQQRHLDPHLGGPRSRRTLERLESTLRESAASGSPAQGAD